MQHVRGWMMVASLVAAALVALPAAALGADAADDEIMGEYVGKYRPKGGDAVKAEAKVIAEGDGRYRAVLTLGEGSKAPTVDLAGEARGKRVALTGKAGNVAWKGTLESKDLLVAESETGEFEGKYTMRTSPTLGQKPPKEAVVLLPLEPGKKTSLDAWCRMDGKPATWEALEDGSVQVRGGNIRTKSDLGNIELHVEFLCPYMPKARGQGRGNSGVYLHSRYEVQVLDSFGLAPRDNECGGIYSVSAPKTIASLPPGRWQTYDIVFTVPTVKDGKIVEPAVMTVRHNGVLIHENVKIDHVTTAGVGGPVVSPAPLMLQDHGNPVRYRNIWYVERKD